MSNSFKKNFLLSLMFFMNMGFFMLIPYLSIYLTDGLGYSATLIGLILAVRLLSQQGLTFFGGVFSDQFGIQKAIIYGCLLRGIGFVMFGLSELLFFLTLASIITGIGGAFFSPAIRAAINDFSTTDEEKRSNFSVLNIIENLSMMLGPLVGLALMEYNFMLLCIVVGSMYVLSAVFVKIFIDSQKKRVVEKKILASSFGHIIKDISFIKIVVLNISFFYAVQQIYLLLPLTAQYIGHGYITSWGFLTLSLTVVVLQIPITKLVTKVKFTELQSMIAGYSFLAISVIPMLFRQTPWSLMLFVIGLSFSLIFINPAYQTVVGNLADKKMGGAYYGFSLLSMAVGGFLGNVVGGMSLDLVKEYGLDFFPWMIILTLSLTSIVGLFLLHFSSSTNYGKYGE